jgi:hypothetical protein
LLIGYFWKMHKNATKCNKTQSKWCVNKHGTSKIIDTFETYHYPWPMVPLVGVGGATGGRDAARVRDMLEAPVAAASR